MTPQAQDEPLFSAGDVCRLTRIGRETLRHWQAVVPALALRRGTRPFRRSDLLGLLVLREAVKGLGLNVGGYPLSLSQLFEQLAALAARQQSPTGFVLLAPREVRLITGGRIEDWSRLRQPFLVLPLAALQQELMEQLAAQSHPASQRQLAF